MSKKLLTQKNELSYLSKLGFLVNPLNEECDNLEQVWQKALKIEKIRDKLSYPIDGLVVKLNSNKLTKELGIVGKTKRGWSAIKFKATEATTKILGISWQVGRTGKITPVADLEPIELQGTTVKRATLHNYKNFLELSLNYGDFVIVRKAGDIIPEVIGKIKIHH